MAEQSNYIPALKFDWLTRFYDPILKLVMPEDKFKMSLIDSMEIETDDRILDFGCGSLTLSILAAKHHPYAEYFAVDVDKKILAIANEKMKDAHLNIFTQHYAGDKLPYPDQFFEKIMSSLVFHHLTLRQKYSALEEIYRVLKPGGKIHIADFGKPSNVMQRVGFYGVQLLDGFETTKDSVSNALPRVIKDTQFLDIEEVRYFNTMIGTVRLLKGTKSAEISNHFKSIL
ncbi:MAG: methyltransferase domain-containing protein [Chryseolinea sp.]